MPHKVSPFSFSAGLFLSSTMFLGADAELVDVYGFFYHALPPEGVFTLEELHAVVRDVWLTRHDEALEQERGARRKGRPKSSKETEIEEIKLRETEEYRTGIGASQCLIHGRSGY